MLMTDIITHKKWGHELSYDEIAFFAHGAADGSIPDYQLSALLMALRLNGMTDREIGDLTMLMAQSGDMVDLSAVKQICVDKHSTGGVGDTTTLVLAPLVAAAGVPVAKISGRGLSHTGGTVDKMESIPGMKTELSPDEMIKQIQRIGCVVAGQSQNVVPADKALYALRDVTSTVDSVGLIASSIMSKKIAGGARGIVLDVKTGSGAIIPSPEGSIELAKKMVAIGKHTGRRVAALVTGMDEPLGTHIGNALEVLEAIDILAGRVKDDLLEVSLTLGSYMLMAGNAAYSPEQARDKLLAVLESGKGLKKLKELIAAQGGDPGVCDDTGRLPRAKLIHTFVSKKAGYVAALDAQQLGLCAMHLGAGRKEKTDEIDPSVGFVLHVRVGDWVNEGDPLFTVHAKDEKSLNTAMETLYEIIRLSDTRVAKPPLIHAIVDENGVSLPSA